MALSPDEIAAIIGGQNKRPSPDVIEAEEAAKAGFGNDIAAFRAFSRNQLQTALERAGAQLDLERRKLEVSGASNAVGFLNANLRAQEIANQLKQFNEKMGLENRQLDESLRRWTEEYHFNKARFNAEQGLAERRQGEQTRQFDATHGLDEAKFNWQKAVNDRDFAAAEFWKKRYYDLDLRKQGQTEYTDEAGIAQRQNAQTQEYLRWLSSMTGPRDWVKYHYNARGMTTPRGEESVPFEKAVPAAFQPRMLPDRASFASLAGSPGSGLPATPGAGAAPPPGAPSPAAPAAPTILAGGNLQAGKPMLAPTPATAEQVAEVKAAAATPWQKQNAVALPAWSGQGAPPPPKVGFLAEDPAALEARIRATLRSNFDRDLASGIIDQNRYNSEAARLGFAR